MIVCKCGHEHTEIEVQDKMRDYFETGQVNPMDKPSVPISCDKCKELIGTATMLSSWDWENTN
jgi:hypothetical protein